MCLDFSKHRSQKSMFEAKLEEKVGEITVKCIHCISFHRSPAFPMCTQHELFEKKSEISFFMLYLPGLWKTIEDVYVKSCRMKGGRERFCVGEEGNRRKDFYHCVLFIAVRCRRYTFLQANTQFQGFPAAPMSDATIHTPSVRFPTTHPFDSGDACGFPLSSEIIQFRIEMWDVKEKYRISSRDERMWMSRQVWVTTGAFFFGVWCKNLKSYQTLDGNQHAKRVCEVREKVSKSRLQLGRKK